MMPCCNTVVDKGSVTLRFLSFVICEQKCHGGRDRVRRYSSRNILTLFGTRVIDATDAELMLCAKVTIDRRSE
jgi:hypothetical protein